LLERIMSWFLKKNVIVPIDFSEESFAALEVALQIVVRPSQVTVVHVLQDLTPLEAGEVWGIVDPQTRIANATKSLRERLQDAKHLDVNIEVLLGDPAHGIANFAQEQKADMIVIPSHGRTGLTRLLIGSTAERVVRLAHCPVLVLRK
jgi:nucleotide-binding universal stress UspA family protein